MDLIVTISKEIDVSFTILPVIIGMVHTPERVSDLKQIMWIQLFDLQALILIMILFRLYFLDYSRFKKLKIPILSMANLKKNKKNRKRKKLPFSWIIIPKYPWSPFNLLSKIKKKPGSLIDSNITITTPKINMKLVLFVWVILVNHPWFLNSTVSMLFTRIAFKNGCKIVLYAHYAKEISQSMHNMKKWLAINNMLKKCHHYLPNFLFHPSPFRYLAQHFIIEAISYQISKVMMMMISILVGKNQNILITRMIILMKIHMIWRTGDCLYVQYYKIIYWRCSVFLDYT